LPISAIASAITKPEDALCQACITGKYPTSCGQQLYQIALSKAGQPDDGRTYEIVRS
jgi:amidophosphoribosyltransferase